MSFKLQLMDYGDQHLSFDEKLDPVCFFDLEISSKVQSQIRQGLTLHLHNGNVQATNNPVEWKHDDNADLSDTITFNFSQCSMFAFRYPIFHEIYLMLHLILTV